MSTNKTTVSKLTGGPYNYDLTSPEEYYLDIKNKNYSTGPQNVVGDVPWY